MPTFSDLIAKACQEERRRKEEQERLARVARLAHASHQETPIPAPREVDLKGGRHKRAHRSQHRCRLTEETATSSLPNPPVRPEPAEPPRRRRAVAPYLRRRSASLLAGLAARLDPIPTRPTDQRSEA